MLRFILALAILLLPLVAQAAGRTVTVRGPVMTGTSDSGLGGLAPSVGFLSDSEIADSIFPVCGSGDECEITGVVDDHGNLQSVISIRKIDTNLEPPRSIIDSSALAVASTKEGINKRTIFVESVDIIGSKKTGKDDSITWNFTFILSITNVDRTPQTYESKAYTMEIVKRGDEWVLYRFPKNDNDK